MNKSDIAGKLNEKILYDSCLWVYCYNDGDIMKNHTPDPGSNDKSCREK